jgi:hypothetical protein
MPFAFQFITRAIVALVSLVITGLVLMYVDDFIGVSPMHYTQADMLAADRQVEGLMGEGAILHSKDEHGRALDVLDWAVNLDRRSVTLSERNMLKSIHAFFALNTNGKVTLLQVERMASLATHASQLCRTMRPYTKEIYGMIPLFKGAHTSISIPMLAKVDITVWRAFLILS